jgi:hypothetical protein
MKRLIVLVVLSGLALSAEERIPDAKALEDNPKLLGDVLIDFLAQPYWIVGRVEEQGEGEKRASVLREFKPLNKPAEKYLAKDAQLRHAPKVPAGTYCMAVVAPLSKLPPPYLSITLNGNGLYDTCLGRGIVRVENEVDVLVKRLSQREGANIFRRATFEKWAEKSPLKISVVFGADTRQMTEEEINRYYDELFSLQEKIPERQPLVFGLRIENTGEETLTISEDDVMESIIVAIAADGTLNRTLDRRMAIMGMFEIPRPARTWIELPKGHSKTVPVSAGRMQSSLNVRGKYEVFAILPLKRLSRRWAEEREEPLKSLVAKFAYAENLISEPLQIEVVKSAQNRKVEDDE